MHAELPEEQDKRGCRQPLGQLWHFVAVHPISLIIIDNTYSQNKILNKNQIRDHFKTKSEILSACDLCVCV